MDYKLTSKYQHSKKCKDGHSRNFLLFYLNNILILKQKVPYDEKWDYGWQNHTSFTNVYLFNGYLYQTRSVNEKYRDVKFPLSKSILKDFNLPVDLKIKESI